VAMKNAVFWDVTPCGSCNNRCCQLLLAVNVVRSSLILSALIMEAARSSEMSILTRARKSHIQEDDIIHGKDLVHEHNERVHNTYIMPQQMDRLCGLVVRVPGC
jgi:uracil phosphoribosyltransferase